MGSATAAVANGSRHALHASRGCSRSCQNTGSLGRFPGLESLLEKAL